MFEPRARPSGLSRTWASTTPTGADVLIVEGADHFVPNLDTFLAQEGFSVRSAGDGDRGLAEFERRRPEIVLVNLAVPGLGGFDLCRRIRAESDVPIIVMSDLGSEVDAVLALEMGADDYVSRGSRVHELVARMRAALRRAPGPDSQDRRHVLAVGPVTLDLSQREATLDGERFHLTRMEYRLLELLMEHPGRVVTRRTIISRVWGEDYVGSTKTLDVHIRRLRTKLEDDAALPKRIVTVRGLGFKLEPSVA